ncbi:MAG: hypothetical protein ABIO65_13670 [Nitrospiria bacterium]
MVARNDGARAGVWVGLLAIWLGMPGFFLCMAGILVTGWQVYVWVKFGLWPAKPLLGVVLDLAPARATWLIAPQSAFDAGLVWTLGVIPLSPVLIASGVALITLAHRVGGAPPARRGWEELEGGPPDSDQGNGRNGHGSDSVS